MNIKPILICLICIVGYSSCSKQGKLEPGKIFVRAIDSKTDVGMVGSILMTDGHYLVVSRDAANRKPGRMVKLDALGKQIWNKPASDLNIFLWQVLALPAGGFLTFGMKGLSETHMSVCKYDNDGNFITNYRINTNTSNANISAHKMILMTNGNYAFYGTDGGYGVGYLKITDSNFKLLYSKAFQSTSAGYSFFRICAMTEMPDGSLAAAVETYVSGATGLLYSNTLLLRTGFDGQVKSITTPGDTMYSEKPNAIIPCVDGHLVVSSRVPANTTDSGISIIYNANANNIMNEIVGRICLLKYNHDGQLINRKEIVDYPGLGVIHSIQKTPDGGFILCGTVNQTSSAITVSFTKIYLLKLDAALNTQWSKLIETSYQAYGINALPTADGGFLVSGIHRSFNRSSELLIVKTDANGNYY